MNNTLFYHGKTTDGNRFTIAGKYEGDVLRLGISVCSKKDQFRKKLGRVRSQGRLNCNCNIKGKRNIFLYSDNPITEKHRNENGMFSENYFKGKETKIFVETGIYFESLTRKELI